jgi:hypothetical protein
VLHCSCSHCYKNQSVRSWVSHDTLDRPCEPAFYQSRCLILYAQSILTSRGDEMGEVPLNGDGMSVRVPRVGDWGVGEVADLRASCA